MELRDGGPPSPERRRALQARSRGEQGEAQALFMGFGKESVASSIHELNTIIIGDSDIFSNL